MDISPYVVHYSFMAKRSSSPKASESGPKTTSTKGPQKGSEAFHTYFQEVYSERWEGLYNALLSDTQFVARGNGFYPKTELNTFAKEDPAIDGEFTKLNNCFNINERFNINTYKSSLLPFYKMDPASIFAALALETQPGDAVLDLCAAPGGKTLVLAETLFGSSHDGELYANELSAKRRARLTSVIRQYVPEAIRKNITVTGKDGNQFGLHSKENFDRILIDAPCSGDRGLVHKPQELETWSVKRTKFFGIRQYSLLASAFAALRPGGTLVYSTCSISPEENDKVIDKLIKKKKDEVRIEKTEWPLGEPTEHGWILLPDQCSYGPIYFCKVSKHCELNS